MGQMTQMWVGGVRWSQTFKKGREGLKKSPKIGPMVPEKTFFQYGGLARVDPTQPTFLSKIGNDYHNFN